MPILGDRLIVHFMRHAQSSHKLITSPDAGQVTDQSMKDPDLSPQGVIQCCKFDSEGQYTEYITHIIASPLTRTLRTASIAFSSIVLSDDRVKIVALPELQSLSTGLNGQGVDPQGLVSKIAWEANVGQFLCGVFSGLNDHQVAASIDVKTHVRDGWNNKSLGIWHPGEVGWRVEFIKSYLRTLARATGPRVEVMVVTHGSFLQKILPELTKRKDFLDDTEVRSFVIEGKANDRFVEVTDEQLAMFRENSPKARYAIFQLESYTSPV